MKLPILAFRSLFSGADSYRLGITFDWVKLLERKPPFHICFGARLRAEKDGVLLFWNSNCGKKQVGPHLGATAQQAKT